MLETESILDRPRDGLDPAVWTMDGDGRYRLTDAARGTVLAAVRWVAARFGLDNPQANITGSIASNQYSDGSDIDVHIFHQSFADMDDEQMVEFNRVLGREFDDVYAVEFPDMVRIGSHPLEMYFQRNPYQDLMSVGCYDVGKGMWLVGPDIKPMDYDPYSEFYSDDMEYIKDILQDIRNIIFKCYETATAIRSSWNEGFKAEEFSTLMDTIDRAAEVFEYAKQCRKVFSSPVSVEDAMRKRVSRKWRIADSAFKLMDRFGYLGILKSLRKVRELSSKDGVEGMDAVADAVIRSVGRMNLDETVDESVKGLGIMMLVASLLAIPGMIHADTLVGALRAGGATNIRQPAVQKAIRAAQDDKAKYGGYTKAELVNIVARTLYVEGRDEGYDGFKAICSVILNRSGNDRTNIAAVLKEPGAFSCWRKMSPAEWDSYVYTVPRSGFNPSNVDDVRAWDRCVELAKSLVDGKFKSTIGNRNSYLNMKIASPKARSTWGRKMDLKVGNHEFGYLREHDPKYVVPGSSMQPRNTKTRQTEQYVVRRGDTLEKIARLKGVSVDDILAKNPDIKNPDSIRDG